MPRKKNPVPPLRHHKGKNVAVVYLNRKTVSLGRWGSPEAIEKYANLVKQLGADVEAEQAKAAIRQTITPQASLSVSGLALRYTAELELRYAKRSDQLTMFRSSIHPLLELFSGFPANEFGIVQLKQCLTYAIETGNRSAAKLNKFRPITRQHLNRILLTIKRLFAWGIENELISGIAPMRLPSVKPIKQGQYKGVIEEKKGQPVSDDVIEKTLPFLQPELQAMVRVQRLAGCRPDEITIIRPCDIIKNQADAERMGVEIDFSSANGNWVYCPFTHKTERWGHDKFITLGKKAQAILTPFLNACELETEYVFNPSKIVARIDKQRTKPGKKTKKRKRYVADCYNDRTYRQQIERACDKAGIPHWTPNQLRHAKATETRRKHGLEATQSVLGHADLRSTQRYAPRTLDHAFYVQSLNG